MQLSLPSIEEANSSDTSENFLDYLPFSTLEWKIHQLQDQIHEKVNAFVEFSNDALLWADMLKEDVDSLTGLNRIHRDIQDRLYTLKNGIEEWECCDQLTRERVLNLMSPIEPLVAELEQFSTHLKTRQKEEISYLKHQYGKHHE